ncbi:MAG: hypothetical protein L6Q92_14360 [Phycisphaerae bacterium]|nr:hypothetical protein [Phycisphaerae bacterium]
MPDNAVLANQYRLVTDGAGLIVREDRGLLVVTGRDRAEWLNNLVTNVVKTLQPGEGNYAFAVNVKGRVVFDLNLLVLEDRLWLDIDRRWIDAARKHLERYTITEDVHLTEITKEFERLGIIGPAAAEVVQRLGFANVTPMGQLQHAAFSWEGSAGRLVRHDFAGLPGVELFVPPAGTAALVSSLLDAGRPSGLARVDREIREVLRIEAGIPASVTDIDEDVIPPETGQIERGISYHKGCYLGQEVIERMRSHGALARRLVGLRLECADVPAAPAAIRVGESEVGRLTSACWSFALGAVAGLGYVKTASAQVGQRVMVDGPGGGFEGEVVALPMRGAAGPDEAE